VTYDASSLDYAANVVATRSAATWAHDHGLWTKAELGEVGGSHAVAATESARLDIALVPSLRAALADPVMTDPRDHLPPVREATATAVAGVLQRL
jgi:fructose-bisphosphate aldolase class II